MSHLADEDCGHHQHGGQVHTVGSHKEERFKESDDYHYLACDFSFSKPISHLSAPCFTRLMCLFISQGGVLPKGQHL